MGERPESPPFPRVEEKTSWSPRGAVPREMNPDSRPPPLRDPPDDARPGGRIIVATPPRRLPSRARSLACVCLRTIDRIVKEDAGALAPDACGRPPPKGTPTAVSPPPGDAASDPRGPPFVAGFGDVRPGHYDARRVAVRRGQGPWYRRIGRIQLGPDFFSSARDPATRRPRLASSAVVSGDEGYINSIKSRVNNLEEICKR